MGRTSKNAFEIFLFIAGLWLSGCSGLPLSDNRFAVADHIAREADFKAEVIQTNNFSLFAYCKTKGFSDTIRVYIEGDGYAWVSRNRPSGDPTPRNPLALRLATQDPSSIVIYLARPYQYVEHASTHKRPEFYWTNGRFSKDVIKSMCQAIDIMKKRYSASRIEIIGYSGGGAVAALVAAKRDDVTLLVTVAGNLDTEKHCAIHRVSPLSGSLNPPDFVDKLKSLRQIHFVGLKDTVVPLAVVQSYQEKVSPDPGRSTIVTLPKYGHESGWAESWRNLLSLYIR